MSLKIRSILLLFIGLISFSSTAQFTSHTLTVDNLTRTYYVHLPANYDASQPTPVVIWLHGMGTISVTDVQNLYAANQFALVSDTANFILLVPVAENYQLLNMRAWNSHAGLAGIYPNTNIHDIDFIYSMLDTAIANYNVNQQCVYLCGFSMGGFMTERMALVNSFRFAAFASVSGTIGSGVTDLDPQRSIPIAHFHGTADNNVKYVNNPYGMDPDSLVNFWIANNNCDTTPIAHTTYSDVGTNGTITIDHYVYSNGNADVEFFKENNATHEWLPKTSGKIWIFFNQHEYHDLGVKTNALNDVDLHIYPNPVTDAFHISIMNSKPIQPYSIEMTDLNGNVMLTKKTKLKSLTVQLDKTIANGIYLLKVGNARFHLTKKIVVAH